MRLHPEQQSFIDKVMLGDDQYHLLLGKAGSGKSSVASILMRDLSDEGSQIISLYPTHAARAIGMEKLREAVGSIEVENSVSLMGSREEDDSIVHLPSGEFVEFRTIHSILGIRLYSKNGSVGNRSIQDGGNFITSILNIREHYEGKNIAVFVDEISMIPLPYVTLEDETKEHPIIKSGGLIQLLDRSSVDYRVIFVGDFNQLLPVKAPMREFAESFMCENLNVHRLKINHRSESQEIVKLGEDAFKKRGILTTKISSPSIIRIGDRKKFESSYLQSLGDGDDAVAIVYTNVKRKYYENMASGQLHEEPNPIFVGNIVLSGATKTAATLDGRLETILYTQERIKILSKTEKTIIPETSWAENPVELPAVRVQRLVDMSTHYFYGAMSVGEKVSQEFSLYVHEISDIYRRIKKFGQKNPEHDFVGLERYVTDKIPNISDVIRQHADLFVNGSKNKAYYNSSWSWDPDWIWAGERAAAEVAALLWAKYYRGVESEILPMKTVVAMTCHTAQGSGRDHVFMDMTDIRKCRSREEKRRLMYVGCTRAKKKLFILE